jgi:hypothetical protein
MISVTGQFEGLGDQQEAPDDRKTPQDMARFSQNITKM